MKDQNDIIFNEYSIDFSAFFHALGRGFSNGDSGGMQESGASLFGTLIDWIQILWNVYTVFAYLISALLIYGIIYAYIRGNQLSEVENEGIANNEHMYTQVYGTKSKNKRWDDVQSHISTNNPNDWKLAIIESDIMLGELLAKSGYAGTTIGEQLKGVSPQGFNTLDQAWKAHRVRNEIAHAGPDFILTKKIAQETITQYKMVFQEFGAI